MNTVITRGPVARTPAGRALAHGRNFALACSLAGLAVPAAAQAPAPQAAPVPAYMEEVPFITSPDNVTEEMLRLAQVRAGDHVIDLGSGDGRIVILAAKRHGATGLGVEIVPDLVERSLRYAREAGVANKVSFKVQDLFQTDLNAASVITMYLLPQVNLALRPRLLTLKPGTRIVSHDWDMGDWKPDQTTEVAVPNKVVGLAKSSKIHMWMVPAVMEGLWCGAGALAGWRLQVSQRFQDLDLTLTGGRTRQVWQGRLTGAALRTQSAGQPTAQWQVDGPLLRLQSLAQGFAPGSGWVAGNAFQRPTNAAGCRD